MNANSQLVYEQIKQDYADVLYSYMAQLQQHIILKKRINFLRWLKIGLSTVSTGTLLSLLITSPFWLKVISGVVSAILLGINLYFKDIEDAKNSEVHRQASDDYWLLVRNYRSLLTDASEITLGDLRSRRDNLQLKTFHFNKKYPKTSRKAYANAEKLLNSGAQDYSDESLEKLLPPNIRD